MASIFWFNQDLRLSDNPALIQACLAGKILPIYILPHEGQHGFKIGKASQIYLHHSLKKLNESLNNQLNFYKGEAKAIILALVKQYNITAVFCSRSIEPWTIALHHEVKSSLQALNIPLHIIHSAYLWEPEKIKNEQGSYYKVFSAYKRKTELFKPRPPFPRPSNLDLIKDLSHSSKLDDLNLISNQPWERKIAKYWTVGEKAALEKLNHFLKNGLFGYKIGRDQPGKEQTSKLSMNLHFGEISPYQVWDAVQKVHSAHLSEEDRHHFLSELTWREFSAYLTHHFKHLDKNNFQAKFNAFPWINHEEFLEAWKKGQTGYPIIDAGMRELWETGYMHNRVRMIVASFLVKNLMIHWHFGQDWFWHCLVDADLANNSASWQWVAGSGADAAPYFRIFNPITQGEKFDANGSYTRKYVPELALLPDKYLFQPWTAPLSVLKACGIRIGENYPAPIVDLASSRKSALEAYEKL